MTDRLAELGALAYAAENTATASTSPNRLGGAGYLHAAYAEYQTWAAANPNTNPSRLSAKGRLFGYFYDNASWSPSALFTAGEQGAWYDPSDFSTMFQDADGTTPVTAVEQPVGLVLDKSKGLVLGPELVTNGDFSNGTTGWTPGPSNAGGETFVASGGVVTLTPTSFNYSRFLYPVTCVIGKTYEIRASWNVNGALLFDPSGGGGIIVSGAGATNAVARVIATATTMYITLVAFATLSPVQFDNISVKELPGNHASQSTTTKRAVLSARKNLLVNTETLSTQNVTVRAVASCISFWGTGSITLSGAATGTLNGTGAGNRVYLEFTPTAGTLTLTVSGTVSKAQLEESGESIMAGPTSYQRVGNTTVDQTDYDWQNFPKFWRFDGVDDSLATASIDFSATDKMSVFAGVRKNNDAGAIVAELSADTNANAGSFYFVSGVDSLKTGYQSLARGTAAGNANQVGYYSVSGVDTAVVTIANDIAGDLSSIRRNGVAGTNGTGDKGTGNFGNYPLYIGQRGGISLPFNGRIYSLIVLGRTATAAEITATEAWVNSKTGAY